MPIELTFNLTAITREDIRSEVVNQFLNESPGTGNEHLASKYIYIVEEFSSGEKIKLSRPAPLNKGFDFVIQTQNYKFYYSRTLKSGEVRTYSRNSPSHDDIISDLNNKKSLSFEDYKVLYKYISDIFNCIEIDIKNITIQNYTDCGIDVPLLLGIIKWFFIEQDITYWNFSGRSMLFSMIPIP